MRNHRLEYYQSGGKFNWGKLIGKIGDVGQKVITNPNVQKIGQNLIETGINVGSQIAIDKLLDPNKSTQEIAREAIAPVVSQAKESYVNRLETIKQQLLNKQITAQQAKQLLEMAKAEYGKISGSGYRNVRREAIRRYKKGEVMNGGMNGGALPLALAGLAPIAGKIAMGVALPAVGGLLAGLLEKVAREKIPV